MDAVLRGASVYVFLLVLFRVFGQRSLAQITTFDFVMLLTIAETTQQALIGDDYSMTNCFILVATLLLLDRVLLWVGGKSRWFKAVAESRPLILIRDGAVLPDRMALGGVGIDDVFASARKHQGLESIAQIKYAVLECDGNITIVPKDR